MMKFIITVLVSILQLLSSANCFYSFKNPPIEPTRYNGEPLFITPFLEKGLADEARNLSKVKSLIGSVESYSGFFTVNKTYNSNIFFWFFPAMNNSENAPVVVWLQGGPGVSSLFGLFSEHGPYQLKNDLKVSLRKYSWTKMFSMLYIDNPVGTGYSFTDADAGYAKNEEDIGVNLYKTIFQFFQLFPHLLTNDFYVTGESYGGKYVPALAFEIYRQNAIVPSKINLKGIAIGNGFSDPVNMLNYGEYLYEIGLIDENSKNVFDNIRDKAIAFIQNKQYSKAFEIFDSLLDSDLTNSSLFTNLTGYKNYYNYLKTDDLNIDMTATFVQQDFVRDKIHVGNLPFHVDKAVEIHLRNDIMKSVASLVEVLLENYKVLFYNGQLDIIVAYPLTVEFLKNLKWSGAEKYKTAPRQIWKVQNQIAGYTKSVGNLTEVLVRNAGHMVPSDQPLHAYDLLNRFVFGLNFS